MQISQSISLKPYNSFGIDVKARYFAAFQSLETLQALLSESRLPTQKRLVLGGGSNVLFTSDFDGLVLRNEIPGISLEGADSDAYFVRVGAGVNWHAFVLDCIRNNRSGVENLSLIPGSVGASPMQNIGAYGVEVQEVVHNVEAWHINDKVLVQFDRTACGFGYRESVFKRQFRNQFVITHVTFRLPRKPVYHTAYGAIQQQLASMQVTELSIAAIAQAIIHIRTSKLPDPRVVGNAGSFFKNPVVTAHMHNELQQLFPNMVSFMQPDGTYKLAAGWLIEQCGWKGYRKGDAGCHENQALVLVNYGAAQGSEIWELSQEIAASVKARFGVQLEPEVNCI